MRAQSSIVALLLLTFSGRVDAARVDDIEYTPGYSFDLVVPEGSHTWPVVVLLHGGSYLAGDKRDLRGLANALAQKGIASVAMNFRLGVPDASSEIETQAYVYPNLLAVFDWLATHGKVRLDPQRVFVAGTSSGGHMAMGAGILYPKELRPRVRLRGAISLYGGTFIEGIEPRSAPLLILQGTDDRACPPEASRSMARRYREAGARCRLVLIEGMGHDWGGEALVPIVSEIAAFVAAPDLPSVPEERYYRKGL